ncbi:jg8954 [Pararge aegeria aegeria]|uniref:Jg8954 protein n=1 Tax=Pararge aegeria aegeria TaxID=348720 RepID=A0A8S4S9E3_9NEOP|nr:jg8954 [Pararge aegeria aegeria]
MGSIELPYILTGEPVTTGEINDINLGLLVEVWNKGVIWDRALGYHYLPLTSVAYDEQECGGRWVELEAQLMMRGGAVVGTTGPTGHALLLDCRFEPPFGSFSVRFGFRTGGRVTTNGQT